MWVKLDDTFSTHPKVTGLSAAIRWTHIRALCHCGLHLTDGALDRGFLHTVPKGHADALVSAGLWDTDDSGVRIHDYLDYNPPRAQVEAERRAAKERRAKAGRNGGQASGDVRANVDGRSEAPSLTRPSPSGSKGLGSSKSSLSSLSLARPAAERERDEVFEAVVGACGWTLDRLTKQERGRANAAAKEMREVNADPRLIRGFRTIWQGYYPGAEITPQTITGHWSAYMNGELQRVEVNRGRR